MPKLEPKQVQKELESGRIWPVYWLYGQERMKSRELLKRIRKAVRGEGAVAGFGEDSCDGSEMSASEILDSAQTLSLGGGVRFLLVNDAHLVKNAEELAPLLGPPAQLADLPSVTVFLSKDLDGRKKFSKLLVEKAAVVPCEEVPDEEREAWIGYLSKRRGVQLSPEGVLRLRSLEPWSLDIVDMELEKFELALLAAREQGLADSAAADVLLCSQGEGGAGEEFISSLLERKQARALELAGTFADKPDEALPLLGLLAWNVRHLALVVCDQRLRTRNARLNPYVAEKLQRWAKHWDAAEVLRLQNALAEIDFSIKQTPRLPLGLWAGLVNEFCGVSG